MWNLRKFAGVLGISLVPQALVVPASRAEPTAPAVMCETYPELASCQGRVPACTVCHESTDPPSWNAFGMAVLAARTGSKPFAADLPDILDGIAGADADGDGVGNLDELMQGRAPALAEDGDPTTPPPSGLTNPRYRVGEYDVAFAFRRLASLFCGKSPSYDEMTELAALGANSAAAKTRLHEKLNRCLGSSYWRDEALLRLADRRIKPVRGFGKETDLKIGNFRVVIGDYEYDYNLWRYALTDDHDARELLTADYFLVKQPDGSLRKVVEVIEKPDQNAVAGGQPVDRAHRAGLLTTQWFLAYNTMFSPLPRVSAAQAYRAYLGADIANNEGLVPVPGEPTDIDKKGVAEPRCAVCHSTLDPLAYAFAEYDGVVSDLSRPFGSYTPARPAQTISGWDPSKLKPVLLGQPAPNLVAWAKVAVASEAFRRNLATMFFRFALGREPRPDEQDEFNELWQSAEADGYSAQKMLHRLVDTRAFGSP